MPRSTNQLINDSTIILLILFSLACGDETQKSDTPSGSASSTVENDTSQESDLEGHSEYPNDFDQISWLKDPSVLIDIKKLYGRYQIESYASGGIDVSDNPKAVEVLFGEYSENGAYIINQYHPLDYEYFGIVASTDYGQKYPFETHFILCSDKTGEPEQNMIIAYSTMGDFISTGKARINTSNATEGDLEIQVTETVRYADDPIGETEGEPTVTVYTLDDGVFMQSKGENCDYSEEWLAFIRDASTDYGDGIEVQLADGTKTRIVTDDPDILLNNKKKWIKGTLCHQQGPYEEDTKYVLLKPEVHAAPQSSIQNAYLAAMDIHVADNSIRKGGDFLAYCDEEHSVKTDDFNSVGEFTEVGAIHFGEYQGCTSGPLMFLVHSNGYCFYEKDLQTDKYWVGDFELQSGLKSGMSPNQAREILGTEMHFEKDLMIYPIYDVVENYGSEMDETYYTPGVYLLFDNDKLVGIRLHQDYLC